MPDNFWSDKMIEEYGKYCVLNNTWLQWEDFKKSKEVKKDYEILTCDNNSMGIHKFVSPETTGCSTNCIETNCKIHSVKRLSDNEVFTIGDKVIWNFSKSTTTLTEFRLVENNKLNVYGEGFGVFFSEIKKVKERVPLFTTTDGKDIYEGDEYVKVNNYSDYSIVSGFTAEGNHNDYKGLKFSTKEAANEYVVLHKPVLAAKDIIDYFKSWAWKPNGYVENKIIELAKSKI